jgi:signal transduction histidine kinase
MDALALLGIQGTPEAMDESRGMVGLLYEVEDTGRGIPVDRLEAIFEPFRACPSDISRVSD